MNITLDHGVVTCGCALFSVTLSEETTVDIRKHLIDAHSLPESKARESVAALKRGYATFRTVVV